MAGVLPDQQRLHIIHGHVVVEGRLDNIHQPPAVQLGPDGLPLMSHKLSPYIDINSPERRMQIPE